MPIDAVTVVRAVALTVTTISLITTAILLKDLNEFTLIEVYAKFGPDGSMAVVGYDIENTTPISIQALIAVFFVSDIVGVSICELIHHQAGDSDFSYIHIQQVTMMSYVIGATCVKLSIDVACAVLSRQTLVLSASLTMICMLCGCLFYSLIWRNRELAALIYALGAFALTASFFPTIENFNFYSSQSGFPEFVTAAVWVMFILYACFSFVPLFEFALSQHTAVRISLLAYPILSIISKCAIGFTLAGGYYARTN